jgi:hypothetical protein
MRLEWRGEKFASRSPESLWEKLFNKYLLVNQRIPNSQHRLQ